MTDWAIPQQAKLKYTQLFNLHDRSRSGFLSGLQCRDILMQSGLPRNILAEIWNLSDIDGDGQLTREEFILAMHLTNQVRAGQTLPQELPPDLVPPSYRRTRSTSATSVNSATSAASSISSGVTVAQTATPGSSVPPGSQVSDEQLSRKSVETGATASSATGLMMNSNSFEDKRRENFEKGRAELERRRLKMIEQQSSVISEELVRCKKQVAEAKSKIDSMRSDRDTKAGLITSLEAQLKTVRDRKAFLDHEELQIIAIARDLNLVNSSHSAELDQQATQAKQESINQMKDKLLEMEKEKEDKVKQLSEAKANLEQSKKELQSVSEDVTKIYEDYKEKIAKAKLLREQFIADNKSKPIDLDSAWDANPSHATNHSDAFKTEPISAFPVSNDDPWAASDPFASSKHTFDEPFAFNKNDSTTATNDPPSFNNNNDSNFEPARDYSPLSNMRFKSNELPAQGAPPSNSSNETNAPDVTLRKKMYRVLYEFEARNPDELTINPGDIVVGSEVVCEPGWLSGETNGKSGLFPEAYVEPLPVNEYPSEITQLHPQATSPVEPTTTTTAFAATTTTAIVKYRVIYAFEARNPDELTINPGDIITGVDAPHEPGWLMGELNGQRGLFPEAYVEQFAEASVDQAATGSTGTLRRGSSSGSLRSKKSRAKKAEVATVIANYRALGQEQLNLEKGQLVLIRRKMDSGWWEGELQIKANKSSLPSSANGCRPVVGDELDHLINELVDSELDYVNDLRLCQSAYIRPLSSSFDVNHIFANWSQLIARHEQILKSIHKKSSANDKGGLDYSFVLERFQHLLGSIANLYVDFCSRQNESARQLGAKMASDIRFKQLVSESQRKLRKLIERQEELEGDQDGGARDSVSRALRNANLPLTTHLLKPMQRITKYGLLFDRMLKLVEGETDEKNAEAESQQPRRPHHEQLRSRIRILKISAQTLCNQVNEACRVKEDDEDNVKRLRWCQSHIRQQVHHLTGDGPAKMVLSNSSLSSVDLRLSSSDFLSSTNGRPLSTSDSLSGSNHQTNSLTPMEQIQFHSNTNCLGPRRILKAGSMIKVSSGRELMVFLFNDFLLLTQIKSGGSQKVEDLFKSERAQQAYYKFYRPPIMLEDIQLDICDMDDLLHIQMNNSLVCPSLNSHSPSSSFKEQEHLVVSFMDRHSKTTNVPYNLYAMSLREKSEWDRMLSDHVARSRDARALTCRSYQMSTSPRRSLSVSESMGRLFVTVLELVRVSQQTGKSPPRLMSLSHSSVDLNRSWDRRMSVLSQVDPVQNLCVCLQLKLYKRTQMILDDNEKREVIPTSDEFRTKPLTISNATRQPGMVDMNESMSNLDIQRDVFRFDNDSTQFLLAANQVSHPSNPEGAEYLEIELIDDSRFRETRQLGRKRINLDQLLGLGGGNESHSARVEDSPLVRKSSNRSTRSGQVLQPNRPVEMTFKLKSVSDSGLQANLTTGYPDGGTPTTGKPADSELQKFSVKLKLHLQLFCDINNLI